MKRLLILLLLLVVSQVAHAAVEVAPFAGYSFKSNSYLYYGKLKLIDNTSYGVNLSLDLTPATALEFQWVGASPLGLWTDYRGGLLYPDRKFRVHYNYFLVGPVKQAHFVPNKVTGFGTFKLGMSYFTTDQNDIEDDYRFAFSVGAGLKVYLTDVIGLRFQGNLHMPMYFSGIGIGVGSGGVSGGAGTTSLLVQGETSVGVIFKLGGKKTTKATPAYQSTPEAQPEPVESGDDFLGDKYK